VVRGVHEVSAPHQDPLDLDASVLVVGAGLGGLRAAEALRAGGHRGRITLLGAEADLPYDRPPLTKQYLAGQWDEARIRLASAEALAERGITPELGVAASNLDAAARTVTLADGRSLRADALVIATGAAPRWLPGTQPAPRAHVVRTVAQSMALRDELDALGGAGRVVVIGGGFIGSEVASTAAAKGLAVTILEALDVPLAPVVGELVGGWLTELHRHAGIDVRAGVAVARVDAGTATARAAVELATGERFEADAVVIGIGVRPATEWLEDSGLAVADGVVCDEALFAADGIVAIGDVARFEWRHALGSDAVRIEHWEVTAQLAAHAATSLLAGRAHAPAVSLVPYFWSEQHGRKIQMLGRPLPADEALLVAGAPGEAKFTVLYHRGGRLSGVLGVASPRQVMTCRPLVEAGATVAEAAALFDNAG
jgi:3-phenylpropionate/trans-cinnamate dioxygenase ferredoxin reductase component